MLHIESHIQPCRQMILKEYTIIKQHDQNKRLNESLNLIGSRTKGNTTQTHEWDEVTPIQHAQG